MCMHLCSCQIWIYATLLPYVHMDAHIVVLPPL